MLWEILIWDKINKILLFKINITKEWVTIIHMLTAYTTNPRTGKKLKDQSSTKSWETTEMVKKLIFTTSISSQTDNLMMKSKLITEEDLLPTGFKFLEPTSLQEDLDSADLKRTPTFLPKESQSYWTTFPDLTSNNHLSFCTTLWEVSAMLAEL